MIKIGELTAREILFVHEYCKDFKKRDAAIAAGVAPGHAHVWANKTIKKRIVQEAIDEVLAVKCEEIGIDAKWLLKEVHDLYHVSLEDIITLDSKGEPTYDFTLATPDFWKAVESIDISPTRYGTKISVKLPSKQKLLETIGRHVDVAAFKEYVEHSGGVAAVILDQQDLEA